MESTAWMKYSAIAFCTFVVVVGGCTAHRDYLHSGVEAKASNPAAIECAYSDSDTQHSAFCLEAVKNGGKQ